MLCFLSLFYDCFNGFYCIIKKYIVAYSHLLRIEQSSCATNIVCGIQIVKNNDLKLIRQLSYLTFIFNLNYHKIIFTALLSLFCESMMS